MNLLNDPHIFTKFLLFVYGCNIARYLVAGMTGNAWYWFAAAQITICATWLTTK